MPVTVRVGAVHLGWDVVSVAAGGGGTPIRPVQVDGSYTTPAYLLADSTGRLHTAGVDRQRPDLGMAIADVRDILGHQQIVIAGATWPAELVFRARLYNPLASVGKYLRGKPDVVALPYPDGWPDEKVDTYCELIEQLDVIVEPLPESVALSGYVRALGLVRAPDRHNPRGVGATGVYSDGRTMLVVAVHADDEQPTESVDVAISPEATRDARSADDAVIEVMAAARAIGADTSTVLLAGNVCFNDPIRLAFQNHLGQRLHSADHPMHALVLGAAHLLLSDSDGAEPESGGRHAEPAPPQRPPAPPRQEPPRPVQQQPPQRPPVQQSRPPEPPRAQTSELRDRPQMTDGRHRQGVDLGGSDVAMVRGGESGGPLTSDRAEPGSRFMRPPEPGNQPGKVWNKMTGSAFGAQAVAGAVALATFALAPGAGAVELVAAQVDTSAPPAACSRTPEAILEPESGISSVRGTSPAECGQPGVDTLRYLVPGPPGAADFGPPVDI
ncbi:hypothetical protein [Nocardia cyriacigeorgica]|uniref:hypothetical protein n=1 Tax=Nocardia cyriacigeorgica TaxID=135487 RepID=UPI0015889D35|nr:hypothetical protein [Nocardia cyriacigeorgica]